MAARNISRDSDRTGAEMAATESLVLDRLVYRNRSQHRSTHYFKRVLEVRRACRALSAPELPDLLAQGLGLIASVPDSRNHRAREVWVRSAAGTLRRMRVAATACAHSLESIVRASKHLAYQVSQTYFMALSTMFLACLARLFACNLHLGGRLLEVHGTLLRALLAQPCTSESLSVAEMAACRIPQDTFFLLSRLRGAQKTAPVRKAQNSSTAAAAAAASAEDSGSPIPAQTAGAPSRFASPPSALPPIGSRKAGLGKSDNGGGDHWPNTGGDEDDDGDDEGVSIGRACPAAATAAAAASTADRIDASSPTGGEESAAAGAVAEAEVARQASGEFFKAAAAGGHGRAAFSEAAAALTAREGGGVDIEMATRAIAGEGNGRRRGGTNIRGGAGRGNVGRVGGETVKPPRKKVFLASEFSDSSSSEGAGSEIDNGVSPAAAASSATAVAETRREPPFHAPADGQARAILAPPSPPPFPKQPSPRQVPLFFSGKTRKSQQSAGVGGYRVSGPGATIAALALDPGSEDVATAAAVAAAAAAAPVGMVAKVEALEALSETTATAATVRGRGGRVEWVIDPRPTSRLTPYFGRPSMSSSLSSSSVGETKNGLERGGSRKAATATAVAATAVAAAVTSSRGCLSTDAPANDGPGGEKETAPCVSVAPGVGKLTTGGGGVVASTPAWRGGGSGAGGSEDRGGDDGGGGGGSGGSGGSTGGGAAPAVERAVAAPPAAEAFGRTQRAPRPGESPPEAADLNRGPGTLEGTAIRRHTQQHSGAGEAEPRERGGNAPGMARAQPNGSGRKPKGSGGDGGSGSSNSGGSGGSEVKRSSQGGGREENSRGAKKQKKKKRDKADHTVSGGNKKRGGGRNPIDDIFGSLL